MHTHLATKKVRLIIGVVIAAFLIMPLLIHAQTTSAIMQDPRSASLTSTQIDAMVTALSAKAQTQGLTAQNIAYRPGTAGIVVPAGVTANTPMVSDPCALSPACAVGNFLGSGLANNATYVALWILSLLLMFIVWHMRKNPHLFGLHDTPNTPAIGGGV
jgi:hypothetical protein